jgi:hypothetical protein
MQAYVYAKLGQHAGVAALRPNMCDTSAAQQGQPRQFSGSGMQCVCTCQHWPP